MFDAESGTRPAPVVLAALLAGLAIPASVRAEARVEIGDLDLGNLLDPVLAAATLTQQRSSAAPASVYVLTAEDVRDHGYATLAEALRAVPGLFTYSDGFYEYVGVRGTGLLADYTTRLLVLVDGHPLNNGLGIAEAHLGRDFLVPLALVERIEVVKGPVGGVYGPTAFLGVVNVVTKAAGSPGGEVALGAHASQGRLLSGEASAAVSGRAGPAQVSAAVELFDSRGYTWTFPALGATTDRPPAPGGRVAGADGSDAQKAYLRATASGIALAGGCGRWFRRLPSAPYSALVGDSRNAEESLACFAALGAERRLGEETRFSGRISWDHFHYRDLFAYEEPPRGTGPFRDVGRDSWLGADLQLEWRRAGSGRLAGGVRAEVHDTVQDAFSERFPPLSADPVNGIGVGPIRKRYGSGHLYLLAEWELRGGLVLHGGLTGTWHELFGDRFTPKLAAVWSAGPNVVKAIYTQGFRPPAVTEAFFDDQVDYSPNPGLRPERVRTAELGFERRHGPVTFAASLFHNWYDHVITLATVPAPGLPGPPDPANPADFRQQFVNAGTFAVYGLDAWAAIRLPALFDVTLGLSAQGSDREVPNRPGATANLSLSTRALWRPLTLAAHAAFLSARQKDHTALAPGESARVGPAVRIGAHARLAIPGVRGLEAEAGVANLLDGRILHPVTGDFAPITEMPEAPRTFRLGLRHRF